MTKTINQQKGYCVFGMGATGLSAARFLESRGYPFVMIDSRVHPPGIEQVHLLQCCTDIVVGEMSEQQWGELLSKFDSIILSPGVDPRQQIFNIAVDSGIEIIGDIELFVRHCGAKIIAITGSNGKSTVTDLTYRLIRAAGYSVKIGGNFGVPVLDFLAQETADYYVLELSSFQLDTTYSLKSDVAVVLNVTEDHMDRYNSFEDYRRSKLHIYDRARVSVYNADDPLTLPLTSDNQQSFAVNREADCCLVEAEAVPYLQVKAEKIVDVSQLKLSGRHNWSNALAALAIINAADIHIDNQVKQALCDYSGLPHRFQLVARKNQVEWINDSKATNVGATQAALSGIDGNYYRPVALIAGGQSKGADLSPLAEHFKQVVDHLFVLGVDADKLAQLVPAGQVTRVSDMKQAVEQATQFVLQNAQQNKTGLVLLSPACASLDMFKNFEDRGEQFKQCVEELL